MYLCKKEEKYLSYVKNFQFLVKDKKSYNLSKKKNIILNIIVKI